MRTSLLLLLLACPAFAQQDPVKALASMKPGEGLQVELFASEPMVINPTAMDIDPLGRVWIAEAVNYRCKLRNKPFNRAEGDRIQVLIDEKGEGKATKAVTFYQGKELYGPLSVCVIPVAKGYRVLVAQSPDILEFTCKDATNPIADGPPKKFLTGFGGFDHDHGVHGLHLGPDGKLYFTVGDQGVKDLQSSDGKGPKFTSNNTTIQKGTVWRCDLDGKNLELIAHNFRNNYEACVDSFGEIWLSDNDDDGNQQTRICFVMPGGNYGYGPRGAGQSHWHEEQPGIVHKTLRTGFGSPTGIQFYEGNLLPKQYHNTLMHTDAGPRELRAFTRKPKGAGYELDKTLMLTSSDTWYRPSDVCTAPDGSVFVCDWYDPGVGGHGMGDWTRGRVYRLTPTGHKGYKVPEVKLDTKEGVLATLDNPCISVRKIGQDSLATVHKPWTWQTREATIENIKSPFLQARVANALPLFTDFKIWVEVSKDVSPNNIAMYKVGTRLWANNWKSIPEVDQTKMAREFQSRGEHLGDEIGQHKDLSREFLLYLVNINAESATSSFYALAKLYDGQDIFYRAALNIACGTDPARRDAILADFEKHFPEWNDKVADLVWELRPKSMMPKMETLLKDAKITAPQKARIVDILAASDSPDAGKTMFALLAGDQSADVKARAIANLKLFLPGKWSALARSDDMKAAVEALLKDPKTTETGLTLIAVAGYTPAMGRVSGLAKDASATKPVRLAAIRAMGTMKDMKSTEALIEVGTPENEFSIPCVQALAELAAVGGETKDWSRGAFAALQKAVKAEKATPELQQAAIAALAGTKIGTVWLIQAAEKKELPEGAIAFTGRLLRNSPFQGERN